MTGFVLASVVMALLALLLLLRPWWQGQAASGRAALEQQVAQLGALREAGTLTAAAHSQAHAALAQQLATMRELHGAQVITRWQGWTADGALEPLFAELMALHGFGPKALRILKDALAERGWSFKG